MLNLDKESPVALHRQLADQLREQILTGQIKLGAKLPTELELAEQYGISRGTIRQAMLLLTSEGLLQRVAGKGTFVSGRAAEPQGRYVGLVLPYARDGLSMDNVHGAESVLKASGYSLLFCFSSDDRAEEARDIQRLRSQGVAGLIIFPITNIRYDEIIWQLHDARFPFVLVDRYFPDLPTDYVGVDNIGGGYRVTKHLIELGHREIAFISTAGMQTTTTQLRFEGYRKALADHGLTFRAEWLFAHYWHGLAEGEGLEEIRAYLRQSGHPHAVFAVSDHTAYRVLHAATAEGLVVPDDLALVGFDDLDMSSRISVPLTTIAQPRGGIGAQAARLLLERLEGRATRPRQIELPVSIVVRESCGAGHKRHGSRP